MKNSYKFMLFMTALCFAIEGKSQQMRQWEDIDTTGFFEKKVESKHGFTLVFINKDSLFSQQIITSLKDAFWKVYPAQVKRFNPKATKSVTVVISEDYKGVAATWKGVVKIDQNWLRRNPEDIDVITHELMHVVQEYGYQVPDGWLVDAIADYGRYAFGVANEKSGWSLPAYASGQSYRNSYRIAARFLLWVEKNKNKSVVEQLDKALRENHYDASIWTKLTGKTVDELWKSYSENPTI